MNEEHIANSEESTNQMNDELINDESFDTDLNESQVESNNENDAVLTQLKEAQEKYVRLYSDFDNFRKRTQKEKADLINYAAGDVIKDLIDVLDDFERAIQANDKNADVQSIKEGFKLLHHKFDNALKQKGLTDMNCQGEMFDAELHEAITNIPAGEDMQGKIVDVVQKGYFLKERVLRYAKVVVGQ